MFDTLADRIRADETKEVSRRERLMRWTAVAVISAGLFVGLVLAVHYFQ